VGLVEGLGVGVGVVEGMSVGVKGRIFSSLVTIL